MRQWIGSALVHIMGCRLLGAKPLPKPMLLVKKKSNFFIQQKIVWKWRLRKCRRFCPREDELRDIWPANKTGYSAISITAFRCRWTKQWRDWHWRCHKSDCWGASAPLERSTLSGDHQSASVTYQRQMAGEFGCVNFLLPTIHHGA